MQRYYECAEKRFELWTTSDSPSFRDLDEKFWQKVVSAAEAKILKAVSNQSIDAYLLSESSLIVSDHRVVMVTCGQTNLANALMIILSTQKPNVSKILYERRNERFPERQISNFKQDLIKFKRFTNKSDIQFIKTNGEYQSWVLLQDAKTQCEFGSVLALEGVDQYVAKKFALEKVERNQSIRDFSALSKVVEGFSISENFFEPYGYSFNAIKGNYFMTLHVNPSEKGSYVFFEASLENKSIFTKIASQLIPFFSPKSYTLLDSERALHQSLLSRPVAGTRTSL